jgi:hypothetical protein
MNDSNKRVALARSCLAILYGCHDVMIFLAKTLFPRGKAQGKSCRARGISRWTESECPRRQPQPQPQPVVAQSHGRTVRLNVGGAHHVFTVHAWG